MSGEAEQKKGPSEDPLLGQLIADRYRIERRVAAGGMGVVYRALQEPLGRPVAVKILRRPQDPRLDKSYAERFLREAAVVANLNHLNTVVVYDYGNDGPHLYFAMEFLEGQTLTQRVYEKGPMAAIDVLHVGRQIASSLEEAHERGLVHRDLKPGNIMICPQRQDPLFVKVLDFGLVKLVTEAQAKKLTQSGIMMGSPRYMSPEQVRGTDQLDHRADIYSFGALMTFCLAGRPPFPDGSQFEAMRHHVYTAPPAIRTLNPRCTVSDELEAAVLRCLAKTPEERFQTMGELLAAFARCPEARGGGSEHPAFDDDDGGPTSVDMAPPGAGPTPSLPPAPGPAPSGATGPKGDTDSQVSQISQSWLRSADGSSLSAAGWLVRGVVAATIVLAGAAAAFFVPQVIGPAEPRSTPLPPSPATPPLPAAAAEAEAGAQAGAPTEAPEPDTEVDVAVLRPVRIVTDPPGALVVSADGETLGSTPLDLEVADDEPLALTLERAGHQAERLRVDGSQDLLRIELTSTEPEPRATTRRRRRQEPAPRRQTETATGDPGTKVIRDPWDR